MRALMAVAGVVAAVSSAHAQQMIPGTITSIRNWLER
jgi:hypothetical protein